MYNDINNRSGSPDEDEANATAALMSEYPIRSNHINNIGTTSINASAIGPVNTQQQTIVSLEDDFVNSPYYIPDQQQQHAPASLGHASLAPVTNVNYAYHPQQIQPEPPRVRTISPNQPMFGPCFYSLVGCMSILVGCIFVVSIALGKNVELGVLAILSLVPAIVILGYLLRRKKEQVSFELSFEMFWFGMLSVIPVLIIESIFFLIFFIIVTRLFLPKSADPQEEFLKLASSFGYRVVSSLFTGFVVAASVEETAKYLCLSRIKKRPLFNNPEAAVIYAVAGALGLATLENIAYVLFSPSSFLGQLIVAGSRALLSVPFHSLTAALIGLRLARRVLFNELRMTFFRIILPSVLLHGLYDFALMVTSEPTNGQQGPGGGKGNVRSVNPATEGQSAWVILALVFDIALVIALAVYVRRQYNLMKLRWNNGEDLLYYQRQQQPTTTITTISSSSSSVNDFSIVMHQYDEGTTYNNNNGNNNNGNNSIAVQQQQPFDHTRFGLHHHHHQQQHQY